MPSQVYPDSSRPAYRYPWYIQAKTDVPGMKGYDTSTRLEGFVGNGDYVDVPVNHGPFIYYNSAGVQQWSTAKTDLHANVDYWSGVMYDLTDSVIYLLGVDSGTTPHTFYFASVNVAGTVVNIGSDQPATDFTAVPRTYSEDTNMYRDGGDGVGNMFLRAGEGNGEQMEINISTGAIVGDVEDVHSLGSILASGGNAYPYKTPNGTYLRGWNGQNTNNYINIQLLAVQNKAMEEIHLPASCGLGWVSSMNPVMWKGYIAMVRFSTAAPAYMGARFFETTEFNDAFDTLARQNGLVE